MKYSSAKEIDVLVRRLVKKGWTFWHGGKHGRLKAPTGGPTLVVPCTPGDRRSFLNFRSDVRNAAAVAKDLLQGV